MNEHSLIIASVRIESLTIQDILESYNKSIDNTLVFKQIETASLGQELSAFTKDYEHLANMRSKAREYVLGYDANGLKSAIEDNSFHSYLNHYYFLPRDEAKKTTEFVQLISYTVLYRLGKNGIEVYVYQRPSKEKGYGNYSIGVGGHINPLDLRDSENQSYPFVIPTKDISLLPQFSNVFKNGSLRELNEEVILVNSKADGHGRYLESRRLSEIRKKELMKLSFRNYIALRKSHKDYFRKVDQLGLFPSLFDLHPGYIDNNVFLSNLIYKWDISEGASRSDRNHMVAINAVEIPSDIIIKPRHNKDGDNADGLIGVGFKPVIDLLPQLDGYSHERNLASRPFENWSKEIMQYCQPLLLKDYRQSKAFIRKMMESYQGLFRQKEDGKQTLIYIS